MCHNLGKIAVIQTHRAMMMNPSRLLALNDSSRALAVNWSRWLLAMGKSRQADRVPGNKQNY